MFNTIAITKPMILIPVDEYEQLLHEAGEKPLPKLAQEIKKAREEFRKKKTTRWEALKNEFRI